MKNCTLCVLSLLKKHSWFAIYVDILIQWWRIWTILLLSDETTRPKRSEFEFWFSLGRRAQEINDGCYLFGAEQKSIAFLINGRTGHALWYPSANCQQCMTLLQRQICHFLWFRTLSAPSLSERHINLRFFLYVVKQVRYSLLQRLCIYFLETHGLELMKKQMKRQQTLSLQKREYFRENFSPSCVLMTDNLSWFALPLCMLPPPFNESLLMEWFSSGEVLSDEALSLTFCMVLNPRRYEKW